MNILAERSFPTFFKEYAPKLLRFYSDWLDWTEQPGNVQYILNHLSTEQDIDESIEAYRTHLRAKLLPEFPERVSIDLKLLLKNVLWLYRAKSSRKAYDFLFQVLFNSPATIWHPRDTMLRTSDGVWDAPHYVGMDNSNEELHELINRGRIAAGEKEMSLSDWLIQNCLGWRVTGLNSRTEAFIAAASSGFVGKIDCLASNIPELTKVAIYYNYGEKDQEELEEHGMIECDPTLSAFKITQPYEYSGDGALTAVWKINGRTYEIALPKVADSESNTYKTVTSYIIGTGSFSNPDVVAVGATEEYDVVNLEAYVSAKNLWVPVTITVSTTTKTVDGVKQTTVNLVGKLATAYQGLPTNVFVLSANPDGTLTFSQTYQLRKKNGGLQDTKLATFYLQVSKTININNVQNVVKKTVALSLDLITLKTCEVSAYSILRKRFVSTSDPQTMTIEELIDWTDVSYDIVESEAYNFESPISNMSLTLTYDFDTHNYVVCTKNNSIYSVDLIATCTIGLTTAKAILPARSKRATVEVSIQDPVVTVGSNNVLGMMLSNATSHFAPGEKVRLLDPNTGQTAKIIDEETGEEISVEPTVLWHAESKGHYTSTKGFLSDINAIQDNHYWQTFSYVVQSDVGMVEWKRIVKTLLHPAGLEIFGEVFLEGRLEDGSGIYYMEPFSFLRKIGIFYSKMIAMSKMAIRDLQHIHSTSRLAQRHSITADLWLYWMQISVEARDELIEIGQRLRTWDKDHPTSSLTEAEIALQEAERSALEAQYQYLENYLAGIVDFPFFEDIRDWYDIRPSDVDEILNANSVLLFRDDGTLINPLIIDWVDFSFTENIDEPFYLNGHDEPAAPHTETIWGTTLHPLHPMIHGTIDGNEYILQDDQEFIPKLHLAFVGSSREACGMLVKQLVVGNEVLKYSDITNVTSHEPVTVAEVDLKTYARKLLTQTQQQAQTVNGIKPNGITEWKQLIVKDFIYVNTDAGLVFNSQSLLKVPDAWVTDDEANRKYIFERNAWSEEKLSIVSYSPYDFSYRIWIERLNDQVQCIFTAYNVDDTKKLPNSVIKNSNLNVSSTDTKSEVVHVEASGWDGPAKNISMATKIWTMSFNDPNKLSSWFDIELPEIVENDNILCFVNGLLQPQSRIKGNVISVDTILDNSSITYSSKEWEFGELSLEEYVYELDSNGHYILIDPTESATDESNWKRKKNDDGTDMTKLVMVSLNETDTIAFQETTLKDWFIIDLSISKEQLENFTLEGILYDIMGCTINKALTYAEIYVLAPIEASRKFRYAWHGWKMLAKRNEYGILEFDPEKDNGSSFNIWPFTYDNARLFPFSAHNEVITSVKDIEVWPNKQKDNPNTHWVVEYRNVSKLLNGYQHKLIVTISVASQKQSETADRILATWWNDDWWKDLSEEERSEKSRRVKWDFLTNESWLATPNFSSTLLFGEDGKLVDPRLVFDSNQKAVDGFDWSNTAGFGETIDWSVTSFSSLDEGLPQKWWSRPLQSETAMEFGTINSSKIMVPTQPQHPLPDPISFPREHRQPIDLSHTPRELLKEVDGNLIFVENTRQDEKLVFVDGLKILANRVTHSDGKYTFTQNLAGKEALAYSMGYDWLMQNTVKTKNSTIRYEGYFNLVKNASNSTWKVVGKKNGSYVVVDAQLDSLVAGIDVGEFLGLTMSRDIGTIWDVSEADDIYCKTGDHSSNEIYGTTEITSVIGDKRRFIDLSFLTHVEILDPDSTTPTYKQQRLYSILNSDKFGVVERIVNLDSNFFMVFIDGKHSPIEKKEWRYLKGTFFLEVEPTSTVEVYIGNPYSYLMPDFAKCCTTSIGELAFNNLRINMVPKHHEELIDHKMFFLELMAYPKHEIEWRRIYKTGISGYQAKNWIQMVKTVQKQSETFDDILYWKQMNPLTWSYVQDPLKMSNDSSMLVFDANGQLIDNIRIDWHLKLMVPYGVGNTVEVMQPDSICYTGTIYFPAWEYDTTEGHSLHTALFTREDGRTEGRYKDLVDSNWDIVYIDGKAYYYDQWFRKEFADLHLEETIFVNEYPEVSEGENLLLMDEVLDGVQDDESLRGTLHSFQIESVRQSIRTLVVGDKNMDLLVEVPAIYNEVVANSEGTAVGKSPLMVFVDGKKLVDGSFKIQIVINGEVCIEGTAENEAFNGTACKTFTFNGTRYVKDANISLANLPSGENVQYYVVLDKNKFDTSTEHIVHVYWPAREYGSSIHSGNLCQKLYANCKYVLWEGIWRSVCSETYDKPALKTSLQKLLQNTAFLTAARKWLATPNGKTFSTVAGIPSNPTAAQLAAAVVDLKPTALPSFIKGLVDALASDPLHPTDEEVERTILLYKMFVSIITIEPPSVEQFREYVQNRFLLFVDGIHIPVSVDSSGRIVVQVNKKFVFAEDYAPSSYDLYCIDLSNSVLRTSITTSSEPYQSLHFQNMRIFQYVETNLLCIDWKTFDLKIKYFYEYTSFGFETTIYLGPIGFSHSSRIDRKKRVLIPYETIDDVLARQQMSPSAWAGLDFEILSKASKSSIMTFGDDGKLVDPFNVDFSQSLVKPWDIGNVIEILMPEDIMRMSKIYWPIYEVDPDAHKLPYEDSRYRELVKTDFHAAIVAGGLRYDIERHFLKEVQDVHEEEAVYIYPRPDHVFELGRYAEFLKDAWWDNVEIVDVDAERLLLTDEIADEIQREGEDGTLTGVAIDADHPSYRTVVIVLRGGQFVVPVPRIGGEFVFIDGLKLRDGSYKKVIIANGIEYVSFDGISYATEETTPRPLPYSPDNIPANVNVQYAIEITNDKWMDDDEHVVALYWPNKDWAVRTANPSNLRTAIRNALREDEETYGYQTELWKDLGFETYKEYLQSKIVLFCKGKLVKVDGNADKEIFLNHIPLDSYSCDSYEFYAVNISNANCRTCVSEFAEENQIFIFDNKQRNIFMESHKDNMKLEMHSLAGYIGPKFLSRIETKLSTMPKINLVPIESYHLNREAVEANNRDTLDNVFCNGSIPVRTFVNPSLFVEQTFKADIIGHNEFDWKVVAPGENVDDLEFVAIDVYPLDENWSPTDGEIESLVNPSLLENMIDGKIAYYSSYVPTDWNFQMYATSRENPEWFLPCERVPSSAWMFYKGWNQRLLFTGIDFEKDIYIVETFDVSMEGSIANTDWVYWLEKEFNKKSTLILDNYGLIEHPEGLEWKNELHIFPHDGTWTAQAEEAEFPAIVNELIPDNIKKKRIMDLSLEMQVGYDNGISSVADASLESIVAINPRIYRSSEWEVLSNNDCIYWQQGQFRNWIAWLRDDDIFDRLHCFVFVNGFKIPDNVWVYDEEANTIKIPLEQYHLISRYGFVKKGEIYDEEIYIENVQETLIDEEERIVQELEENANVIVDANWAIWKDKDGLPYWGDPRDIQDDWYVVVSKPDPREGIIWPISRIWKKWTSCTSAGIDVPEYLGYDLKKYVMAWVNGRYVQCRIEGTRIFVPGCETAKTVEVYVFELHDGTWVDRFDGIPDYYNLSSFRDLRVC